MSVLGLIFILTIAVLLLPVAKRVNFPHTVLLAIVGIALGAVIEFAGTRLSIGFIGDLVRSLSGFHITADMVMFVFLPTLVFESALSIDVRRLMEDIGPILFLAVIGLLISTFVVALPLHWATGTGLLVCLLLGCIVSATDPVAVVALFKELGAPKRLTILVEGESLFNDATAIVLFGILLMNIVSGVEVGVLSGIWQFLKVFVGGVLVGYVIALAFSWVIGRLRKFTLVCITLTIVLAYLAFIVAEHYLHVSGVMAVVTAGLVIGSRGRVAIPPEEFHALHEVWGQLGFWAISVIFILVGLAVPALLAAIDGALLIGLMVVILTATLARVGVIYGLLPLVSRLGLAHHVSSAYSTVMVWGGLRGAVSLALVLIIVENDAIAAETRQFLAVLVTGFVLFTLFVQATTIRKVMSWLGLDELAPRDRAIRDRAMARTLTDVSADVARMLETEEIESGSARALLSSYERRAAAATETASAVNGMSTEDWITVGLATLVAEEKHRYLEQFGQGFIPPRVLRELVVRVEDIADALKAEGVEGYAAAVAKGLGFSRFFRIAMRLQRRIGLTGPLTYRMALRFQFLFAMRSVLDDLLTAELAAVRTLVGEVAGDGVDELLRERLEAVGLKLAAIRLQYPEYAQAMERRHFGRVAMRLEKANYAELHDHAIISQDIHENLLEDIDARSRGIETLPKLDLGLEPRNLIAKVSVLSELSGDRILGIARLLKPYLAVPDETVCRKGDAGDALYFVSNGSLDVDVGETPVQLGSGDFFGEKALLAEMPRTATVRSIGFSELLILKRDDFLPFLEANPDLKERIERVAAERFDRAAGN